MAALTAMHAREQEAVFLNGGGQALAPLHRVQKLLL